MRPRTPAAAKMTPISNHEIPADDGCAPVGGRATGGNEPPGGAAGGAPGGGSAGGATGGGAAGGGAGRGQVFTLAPATSLRSAVSRGCAERLVKSRLLKHTLPKTKAPRSTIASLKSRGAIRLSPAGASPVPFWFTTRQLFEPLVEVGSQTGTFQGGAWMSLLGFVRRRLSPWEPPQRLGAGANVLPFQAKTSSSGLVPPPTRVKETSRSPGVRLKSRTKVAPPLL